MAVKRLSHSDLLNTASVRRSAPGWGGLSMITISKEAAMPLIAAVQRVLAALSEFSGASVTDEFG